MTEHDERAPDLDVRHDQWLREQYLRDLDRLDHIEAQRDCFFDTMGEQHAARGDTAQ